MDISSDLEVINDHVLFSPKAEVAVIGGLMLSEPDAYDLVSGVIKTHDFFDKRHQIIFDCLGRLTENKEPFDPITVCDDLNSRKELNAAGDAQYISNLATNTPSAANVESYARIVKDKSTLRQMIGSAQDIMNLCRNSPEIPLLDKVNQAQQKIMDINADTESVDSMVSVSDALKGSIDRIEELYESDESLTGVSTGFTDLDEITLGLQKKDFIILAARPSMGKTAFAVNLIETAAFSTDAPIIFYSVEMDTQSIMNRLLASVGKIELKNIMSGNLNHDDWDKLAKAATKIKGRKVFIDDTSKITPSQIRARTRKIRSKTGMNPGLIVVDYIQIMRTDSKPFSRENEIAEISSSLKSIAKEFDCPVIGLSQLNRDLEKRENKRPRTSDLRESGALEQDADVIMFLYREEVYDKNTGQQGVAEVIIGKQRNGELGTVRLQFQGQYTRFNNLTPEYRDPIKHDDTSQRGLNY